MFYRLLSVGFLFLTIFFFWHVKKYQFSFAPKNNEVAVFKTPNSEKIVPNEFLLLMEEGREESYNELLTQYNLKLISSLGDWLHVASKDQSQSFSYSDLKSPLAQENAQFALKLQNHPDIHSVSLNYIQNDDGCFLGCQKSPEPASENNNVALGLDQEKHEQPPKKPEKPSLPIVPKDPLNIWQWHLSEDKGINLPQAWAITTGSPKNVIAVVDRNIAINSPDLNGQPCANRQYYYEKVLDYFPAQRPKVDADKDPHGTNVLNILAPCTDNATGMSGIDWHAQIFAVDSLGDKSLSARLFGLMWAAGLSSCPKNFPKCPYGKKFQTNQHPASIINASFGFSGSFLKNPPYGPVLDIIGQINRQGQIIVASAGNEKIMADKRLPGSAGGVISVASSNQDKKSSSFNNFGRSVDVLAPGEKLFTLEDNEARYINGTSFAAPIVSGVVSLMLAANPSLSWKEAEYILKETATPLSCEDYCHEAVWQECSKLCCYKGKNICASGIVNAEAAVKMAAEGLVNKPLVDFDDYYIALANKSDLRAKTLVKNWGGQNALVSFKAAHPDLKIYPQKFILPAQKKGQPGLAEITVYFDSYPRKTMNLSLTLFAALEANPKVITDSIDAIVAIAPDN